MAHWFAALVPYRLRTLHRWYASVARYFWSPCPLCGEHFGGHEWGEVNSMPATIPAWESIIPGGPLFPGGTRRGRVLICPPCTRAGFGIEAG